MLPQDRSSSSHAGNTGSDNPKAHAVAQNRARLQAAVRNSSSPKIQHTLTGVRQEQYQDAEILQNVLAVKKLRIPTNILGPEG